LAGDARISKDRRLDVNRKTVDTAVMKTTFDLPDPLLRRAKALAAQQGRPLHDLVSEAIGEKLERAVGGPKGAATASEGRREVWERWRARLERLQEGSWFNPGGIEDESFFQTLEEIRREAWTSCEPFGDLGHSPNAGSV
jgi:hypothetical protein